MSSSRRPEVRIREGDLMAAIMALPSTGQAARKRTLTPEEAAALLAGRKAMKPWRMMAEVMHISENTLRRCYRELQG